MKETTFGLLIPEGTDAPDGPAQIGGNAEKTDVLLGRAGALAKASIIATEESRENVAYGALTTPDQVEGLVLPTKGLIYVVFDALWKCGVGGASANAAIFLGANQVTIPNVAAAAPIAQAATIEEANAFAPLESSGVGLVSFNEAAGGTEKSSTGSLIAVSKEITGGRPSGGMAVIKAAAGTYTVSVRFKASAGKKATVKDRSLYCWVKTFA